MVWGVVTHQTARTRKLNSVRYSEDILPHVVPFLQAHPDMTLQHDNATSHTAHSVRGFLQDKNVSVLPLPVTSPDLEEMYCNT